VHINNRYSYSTVTRKYWYRAESFSAADTKHAANCVLPDVVPRFHQGVPCLVNTILFFTAHAKIYACKKSVAFQAPIFAKITSVNNILPVPFAVRIFVILNAAEQCNVGIPNCTKIGPKSGNSRVETYLCCYLKYDLTLHFHECHSCSTTLCKELLFTEFHENPLKV
jgi:hypothetical protein